MARDLENGGRSEGDFFARSGLTSQDQRDCYEAIERLFPNSHTIPIGYQGYCSFTLLVGEKTVVQFRPEPYRLDLQITAAAVKVYRPFAPDTRYVTTLAKSGLYMYTMERIEGVSYKDFRAQNCSTEYRARLCTDFAAFLSNSWHSSSTVRLPLGRVGKSIMPRLKSLSTDLPSRFQPVVRKVMRHLPTLESLPWVLTHGDVVATNIMVDPRTGHLTGMVDWAEAESLPFGICIYGLEEILGEMTTTGFRYHEDASNLRETFWTELGKYISELQEKGLIERTRLARDLGVLLWHGFAFDDGAIDRVVQEGRDGDEIRRLDAFLDL